MCYFEVIHIKIEREVILSFKNTLKASVFWNKYIISLNEEIEQIIYILMNISPPNIDLNNVINLRDYEKVHLKRIELYDKINELEKEKEKYQNYFLDLEETFQYLNSDMKNIIIKIYYLQERYSDVSKEVYMSTRSLKYEVDKQILSAWKQHKINKNIDIFSGSGRISKEF